jgi:hypothetical protein
MWETVQSLFWLKRMNEGKDRRMPMTALVSATTADSPRPLRLAALGCAILGGLLVAALIASQVIWALNPYKDAMNQVNRLLQTHPDLETRLDYLDLARSRLSSALDPQFANAVADAKGSAETQLVDVLAPAGINPADIRTFTSLMNNVSVEILALNARLQGENLAAPLKPVFYQIRQQPEIIDSARLNQINQTSPMIIEDINDIRRRLLSISNNLRLIAESSDLQPIIAALTPGGSISLLEGSEAGVYISSYTVWKSIPDISESLEIQFAGTVSILNDIFTTVNAARQEDQRWGYLMWEPAALWFNRNVLATGLSALLLLITAAGLSLRSQLIRLPFLPDEKTARKSGSTARITSPVKYLPGDGMEGLPPAAETIPASQARRRSAAGDTVNPRLLVLRPNGERETMPLSPDKAFRIGSDPRNPLFIDNREAGYIEIWIRNARAGYFIEVMFCESPVTLNRHPITGARSLRNGDLIQILDISLIFFEN